MSLNSIRSARPGFILIFAGALATSGAADFDADAVGGGDSATFGAAGGAGVIFSAADCTGEFSNGGGGGTGAFNLATDGGGGVDLGVCDFGAGTFATLTGADLVGSFGLAFFGAGFERDF